MLSFEVIFDFLVCRERNFLADFCLRTLWRKRNTKRKLNNTECFAFMCALLYFELVSISRYIYVSLLFAIGFSFEKSFRLKPKILAVNKRFVSYITHFPYQSLLKLSLCQSFYRKKM